MCVHDATMDPSTQMSPSARPDPEHERQQAAAHDTQQDAWIRLLSAEGVTLPVARSLVSQFGDAEAVVTAALERRIAPPHGPAITASDPLAELDLLGKMNARFMTPWSRDFPEALVGIPDPSGLLRVQGTLGASAAVAIVGTRRCSPEGERAAHFFAREIARCGVTIVSGGARGIDAAAHRGALEAQGHTIVILGSGLAQPYPPEHAALYRDIIHAGGAVISEHHVDQRPRPGFFPRRNRLISGLSLGVLVIEAPRRSGAMLTARLAVEAHGRDCWAMVADADRRSARGGLEAIRDGWAKPVLDPIDVLGDLPCVLDDVERSADDQGLRDLPERDDLRVLGVLVRHGQDLSTEAIAKYSKRPPAGVLVALTRLQLLGAVIKQGGNWRTTAAGVAWLGEAMTQ